MIHLQKTRDALEFPYLVTYALLGKKYGLTRKNVFVYIVQLGILYPTTARVVINNARREHSYVKIFSNFIGDGGAYLGPE